MASKKSSANPIWALAENGSIVYAGSLQKNERLPPDLQRLANMLQSSLVVYEHALPDEGGEKIATVLWEDVNRG